TIPSGSDVMPQTQKFGQAHEGRSIGHSYGCSSGAGSQGDWGFGDFQSLRISPGEHPKQPIETSQLEAAIARAAEGNTRDKLPMSSREKTETAWRLTLAETSFSKAKVAELSGASARTVATMREVRAKLIQLHPERDLSELSWNRARMLAKGEEAEEINWDDRIEQEAREFANLLAKHLGKRGHQRREAFARALEIYDDGLPAFLRGHWATDDDEEIDIDD
ncbi:hypothetical protein, partial [uncultured Zoogloea sp.]|uniref:hypothetical protein n=1 Tax=uncultured Zoogloea sp. TaxID=160237 RepID=UPI0026366EAC